jgi:putative Ig domain-containing protein
VVAGSVQKGYSVEIVAAPYEAGTRAADIKEEPRMSNGGRAAAGVTTLWLACAGTTWGQNPATSPNRLPIPGATALAGGISGTRYSVNLPDPGGVPPYTWSVDSGALPAGLMLDPLAGTISGTLPASGNFGFVLSVADGSGETSRAAFSVQVSAPPTFEPLPRSFLGVFRNAGAMGQWALDRNADYTFELGMDSFHNFGLAGDIPVAGDWTGTSVVRMGVFRCPPAGAGVCQWYLDLNNDGRWSNGIDGVFSFGLPGDIPVTGDWTGDGRSKFGVFRCPPAGVAGVCQWILDMNGNNAFDAGDAVLFFGLSGDQPVVGHWSNASILDQIGVFRCPSSGAGTCTWIVDSNGSGAWEPGDAVYAFGLPGDMPVVGDWGNFGLAQTAWKIGVFRGGMWILDTNGNHVFDMGDEVTSFGLPGDKPSVGNWPMPPMDPLPLTP